MSALLIRFQNFIDGNVEFFRNATNVLRGELPNTCFYLVNKSWRYAEKVCQLFAGDIFNHEQKYSKGYPLVNSFCLLICFLASAIF